VDHFLSISLNPFYIQVPVAGFANFSADFHNKELILYLLMFGFRKQNLFLLATRNLPFMKLFAILFSLHIFPVFFFNNIKTDQLTVPWQEFQPADGGKFQM
jgi:hypothetical protein